jgi:uncharacterized protein YerC
VIREVEPEFKESVKDLCQALIACCSDEQLLERFLRDLWTLEEAKQFASRWKAARLLQAGRTQKATARELCLSTKTVNIVARFVEGPYAKGQYATGGYIEVAKRLQCGGLERQRR